MEAFVERLSAHDIEQVADVRRYPASRRHPHFNRELLETALKARGIGYRWFEGLGGRRPPSRGSSSNRGLESSGFRSYADYTHTEDFAEAFAELLDWLPRGPTAILCAEALWWKCHRRLLADQLVARGGEVHHILDAAHAEPHRLWDLAVRTPDGLIYPPRQGDLDLEWQRAPASD